MKCDQIASVYRSHISFSGRLALARGVQPLHIERPGVERSKVIELDDDESAVQPSVTSAEVGSFWKITDCSCAELELPSLTLYISLP